jgi:hypothetical protein
MRPRGFDVNLVPELNVVVLAPVTIYEEPGFSGRSIPLGIGEHALPSDFNDAAASVQVAPGHVAWLYQHADAGGGYGLSVDLMEDCLDLTEYGLSKQVSYVSVFAATNASGHIWVRGKGAGESYVPGHWERPRASGESPNDAHGAVSPPLPSRAPQPVTTVEVSGSAFHITSLGPQEAPHATAWQHAVSHQLGVLGSDYRGPEPIGSASFERASNNEVIPDFFDFWVPQQQPRDHREHPYFKRTCVGTAKVEVSDIEGTYRDQDLNIYITPDEPYQYLITEGHPREYTNIMKAQYAAGLSGFGKPNCDDEESIRDFSVVEAEVQASDDLASGVAEGLRDRFAAGAAATGSKIGVYGPWIYDKGHCCHSEIHPSEQIWWRENSNSGTTYQLNVICDASKRFWWRSQMDGDLKLKPWGAPPIKGVFAIAFEVALPGPEVATSPLEFVVTDISRHNVMTRSSANETALFYNGMLLVKFVPNGDSFAASFEGVGLGESGHVRGFLVLETTVGRLNQTLVTDDFPAGTDVNSLNEDDEHKVFEKEAGHYMFSLAVRKDDAPVVAPT